MPRIDTAAFAPLSPNFPRSPRVLAAMLEAGLNAAWAGAGSSTPAIEDATRALLALEDLHLIVLRSLTPPAPAPLKVDGDRHDAAVQASYRALARAVPWIRQELPGMYVEYESRPGFINVRLKPDRSLSFGLDGAMASGQINILDPDGSDSGVIERTYERVISTHNDDPLLYAESVVKIVRHYLGEQS